MKTLARFSELKTSWLIQRRVIGALLLREVLTRYGRHNIGFLWLFAEPMIFTLGVTTLWTVTKATHGSSLPIVAFAITGYSSVLLWRNMPGRCIGAIQPNLSLLFHRQVRVEDIFFSRLLLEAMGATSSFMGLSIMFIAIGWLKPPEDVAKVIEGWFMLAWFGAALAILLGALAEQSELVDKFWHPFSYLLFPLSGAAFLVDSWPVEAQKYILYLPMVHGVEFVRDGFFGSEIRAHYDVGYMATFSAILTVLGFAQMRKISRTVIPE
ncbi:sugar ABC transporter permease [Sphingobium sp. 22B]|uniref:ABC transporter permease n=1 Tax=unclassified Sphingobium TaxID=2611147 RepID=UPI000783AF12|nr:MULTISPECIES: ABC transporter permease [unclassified Sphingobium]KXU29591.1 sugar ABC transporter permease [Sphingobium sp. AM]KYC29881.1 sugar ABC transporter permease [Sphingobium sp. 22B]OAP31564.1 sugar ABC transporter permease [Sphingobium sp. 20006FA]